MWQQYSCPPAHPHPPRRRAPGVIGENVGMNPELAWLWSSDAVSILVVLLAAVLGRFLLVRLIRSTTRHALARAKARFLGVVLDRLGLAIVHDDGDAFVTRRSRSVHLAGADHLAVGRLQIENFLSAG